MDAGACASDGTTRTGEFIIVVSVSATFGSDASVCTNRISRPSRNPVTGGEMAPVRCRVKTTKPAMSGYDDEDDEIASHILSLRWEAPAATLRDGDERGASCPSWASATTVLPAACSDSIRVRTGSMSTPDCAMNAGLPTATRWPSTSAVTPLPALASNFSAAGNRRSPRAAASTTARARGCSEYCSAAAARRSASSAD